MVSDERLRLWFRLVGFTMASLAIVMVAASIFLAEGASYLGSAIGPVGTAFAVAGTAVLCVSTMVSLAVDLPQFFDRMRRVPRSPMPSPAPGEVSAASKITGRTDGDEPGADSLSRRDFTTWLIGVMNAGLAGIMAGPVFLFFYYFLDFARDGGTDISERYAHLLCPVEAIGKQISAPTSYPALLSLIPEFLGFGLLAGLTIGALLPGWRRFLGRLNNSFGGWRAFDSPYVTTVSFGLAWGTLLGASVHHIFIGQNDGRPFMKLSTAAYASQVSVSVYLILQLIFFRMQLTFEAIRRVLILGVLTMIFSLFFLSLDHIVNLSTMAYCKFYAAWDSTTNSIVRGPLPVMVGAAYGGWIGVLVMGTVGGYLRASDAIRLESGTVTAAREALSGTERASDPASPDFLQNRSEFSKTSRRRRQRRSKPRR